MKNWHEKTDTQMDTDYALGGGQSTKAQLYLHVLCNNCIGSSWVDETMGIRADKWIGNMCGRSNQSIWRAASPFEAIWVDGSQKRSVIWHHGIPAQVVAVVVFCHVWWEPANFLWLRKPQKVSCISFDLICCAQKSISSLSYHHHRTCRPSSRLGQLFRGELGQSRGWPKTELMQERCVSDEIYTSYH